MAAIVLKPRLLSVYGIAATSETLKFQGYRPLHEHTDFSICTYLNRSITLLASRTMDRFLSF